MVKYTKCYQNEDICDILKKITGVRHPIKEVDQLTIKNHDIFAKTSVVRCFDIEMCFEERGII